MQKDNYNNGQGNMLLWGKCENENIDWQWRSHWINGLQDQTGFKVEPPSADFKGT